MIKRNYSLDVLRILATLMVVFSHVAVYVLEREDFFYGKSWWLSYFLSSLSRIATPIFFILSGYLFANKNMTEEKARKRAFSRLMVPYMFFSTLGAVMYNQIEFRIKVVDFLGRLFWGGYSHLYFLTGLFILYLLNPSIRLVFDKLKKKKRRVVVGVMFLNSALISMRAHAMGMSDLLTSTFLYWFLALGYYLFGLYFSDFKKVLERISSFLVFCVYVLVSMGNFYIGVKLSEWADRYGFILFKNMSEYTQNYFSIFQMMSALLFFVWLIKIDLKVSNTMANVLEFLSEKSYGLYLCHMMILEYLTHKTLLNTYDGVVGVMEFMGLAFVVTVVLGYLISGIISRIKYFRVVIGIDDLFRKQ